MLSWLVTYGTGCVCVCGVGSCFVCVCVCSIRGRFEGEEGGREVVDRRPMGPEIKQKDKSF